MASKPSNAAPLAGQALADASVPFADTPKGGIDQGFDGSSNTKPKAGTPAPTSQGLGSWLEDDDGVVFQRANNLVLRQELLAINRLAQDVHYTRIKLGYPFSILEKDPNKDVYRSSLPTGTKAISVQAVPNQAWDLVNKATEAVLSDPPQADPEPLDDSEEAQAAAKMAERFLTEDAGEDGTNDIALLFNAVDKALTCSTAYLEVYTDPVGGGYVPLQILAHPLAQDPANPLVGPDGMPTANPILRYITAPDGGQFTDEPAHAAPTWQPKIRANVWGREHWRVYPETQTVNHAEKVIGLLYCTLSEAKRRWPTVAAMTADELNGLLGWQPVRYLVLLPPFERARWRTQTGADTEKHGSSDERLMFYYRVLQKPCPDHPHGADVITTGAFSGRTLDKKPLSADVEIPTAHGPKQERRCMDIPLIQITPRADPDDKDPTGRAYIELFCGASEFNATLATGYLEALQLWLHPEKYSPTTSPVQGFQITESRATGDAIPILTAADVPQYGPQPPLPPTFFTAIEWNDQAIRSIASLNKPVTGQDSHEVSGKARQIAVQQGMVGLSRMQHPVNAAYERFCRVKIQSAMRDFSTPQTIRYVGEDGAWMAETWKGTDFALVGSVGIQAGTGTMLPPEQKLQFLANLKAEQMLPAEEASDAARPTYAQRLGLPDDPHENYIERCVTTWMKGPPDGWVAAWQQYTQQMQAYQAQQQQLQAQQAQQQQQGQLQQQQQMQQAQQQAEMQHATALRAMESRHTMAEAQQAHEHQMAQKTLDGQLQANAPPPQPAAPPPEIIVPPPDMTPVAQAIDAVRQTMIAIVQADKPPVVMHHEAPPSVVNVHPAAAPQVTVTPQVSVAPADVTVNVPEKKARKRKGKMKGPDGQTYTMESEPVED